MDSRAGSSLRSLTYRLSAAPPKQLLHIIHPIATALVDCKSLFANPPAQNSAKDSADAVTLHKFKTQLSSLLNGKTAEARCAGAILVKTVVEVGGWETLRQCGPWVRALLAVLTKPDPPSAKKVAMVALTRIFMLTHEYPTLVREITTPSLPAYVTACLNLVAPKTAASTPHQLQAQTQHIPPVLESFKLLLPHHPTIFRSYLSQLRELLLQLVAPTPSSISPTVSAQRHIDPATVHAAQALYPLLSICAPKSASSDEWNSSVTGFIADTHDTANKTFRSVLEDWMSVAGAPLSQSYPQTATTTSTSNGAGNDAAESVAQKGPSPSGLPPWTGIHASCERLTHLLHLLSAFTAAQTAAAISFPTGRVVDLLLRILSVTVPPAHNSGSDTASLEGIRFNNQIGADERDAMFSLLPTVHAAAVALVQALCARFRSALLPVLQMLTEHVVWVVRFEGYNQGLRDRCYVAITAVLEIAGLGMNKEQVVGLGRVVRAACEDILPPAEGASGKSAASAAATMSGASGAGKNKTDAKQKPASTSINADSFLGSAKTPSTTSLPNSKPESNSALTLLTTALLKLPAQHIPESLRALMDRTAVLCGHQPAMMASVLNPPVKKSSLAKVRSSILPLLARAGSGSLEVEGLLRPRLPVVRDGNEGGEDEEEEEEEEEYGIEVEGGRESEGEEMAGSDGGTVQGSDVEMAGGEGEQLDSGRFASTTAASVPAPATLQPPASPQPTAENPGPSTTAGSVSNAGLGPHPPTVEPVQELERSTPLKRAAPGADTSILDSKRTKLHDEASLVLEARPAHSQGGKHDGSAVPVPTIVAERTTASTISQIATLPVQTHDNMVVNLDESDEEDFEMPPLTLEQDTEEEEENEEGLQQDDQDELDQP